MDRKKSQGAILTSDKIDFKRKAIKVGTEGHFITLKVIIQSIKKT